MNRRSGSLTKKALSKVGFALLEIIGAFADAAKAATSVPYKRMYGKSEASYYRALNELKNKKLIAKRRSHKRSQYILTMEGRSILQKPKHTEKRSDGFSTVIIFDIPEEKSRERAIFRRYLLRNGYSSLQESVFIGPHNITRDLKDLIRELKIQGYVNSFDAKMTFMI